MSKTRKDNKGRVLRKGESQRKDGSYMYRWTDTNKIRQCIYSSTLNELREQETDIAQEIANGVVRKNMTLNALIEMYLLSKSNIKRTTHNNYWRYYKVDIKNSFLGNMNINSIKKVHILKYYKELSNKGLANSTIAIFQKIIRPSFQLAVDSDLLAKNPADNCLKEYTVKKEVRYALTIDQEKELLERCDLTSDGKFFKPLICTILYTGLRLGEVLGLTWEDIDFDNKTINVDHHFVCGTIDNHFLLYMEQATKNGECRIVPMNNMAYEWLRKRRKQWMIHKKDLDYSIDGYSNFVFLNQHNGKICRPAVIRRFLRDKIVTECNKTRKIQLPATSPHILRHTFCTRLAEAGVDLKTMQFLMGHEDIKITLEVYDHINENRINGEINKLNEYTKLYTQSYTNLYTKAY